MTSLNRKSRRKVFSNLLLFLISIFMVLGFFFHAEFYKVGLVALVFGGGFIVFAILKVISVANSNQFLTNRRMIGNLLFPSDKINSILYGEISRTIRPMRKSRLRVGMVCNVRTKVAGTSVGKVAIKDVKRKRLGQITERDILSFGDAPSLFMERWMRKHGGNEDQIVRIMHITPL